MFAPLMVLFWFTVVWLAILAYLKWKHKADPVHAQRRIKYFTLTTSAGYLLFLTIGYVFLAQSTLEYFDCTSQRDGTSTLDAGVCRPFYLFIYLIFSSFERSGSLFACVQWCCCELLAWIRGLRLKLGVLGLSTPPLYFFLLRGTDPSVICWTSPEHRGLLWVGIFGMIVYVVGVPATFLGYLVYLRYLHGKINLRRKTKLMSFFILKVCRHRGWVAQGLVG